MDGGEKRNLDHQVVSAGSFTKRVFRRILFFFPLSTPVASAFMDRASHKKTPVEQKQQQKKITNIQNVVGRNWQLFCGAHGAGMLALFAVHTVP